ncbi:MAG TPA: hypothetical protein VFD92_14950 [Candidatus Binatia bacterium]|nr:hypothetical protein [Candidatus Binatia bacterium]
MGIATSSEAERSRRSAGAVLQKIFGRLEPGIRYRLWDGSEGEIGTPDGTWTLVIRDRDAFRETFGSNDTRVLGEAFIDDHIDVEGDLFNALRIANQLEELDLGWMDKIGIWLDLRGV